MKNLQSPSWTPALREGDNRQVVEVLEKMRKFYKNPAFLLQNKKTTP